MKKQYHAVGTIPKSNIKIVERATSYKITWVLLGLTWSHNRYSQNMQCVCVLLQNEYYTSYNEWERCLEHMTILETASR
jgi:hypothetical protein